MTAMPTMVISFYDLRLFLLHLVTGGCGGGGGTTVIDGVIIADGSVSATAVALAVVPPVVVLCLENISRMPPIAARSEAHLAKSGSFNRVGAAPIEVSSPPIAGIGFVFILENKAEKFIQTSLS